MIKMRPSITRKMGRTTKRNPMDHVVSVKRTITQRKSALRGSAKNVAGAVMMRTNVHPALKIETVQDDYMNPSNIDSLEHCG